jgi:ubiquilin
MMQQMARASAPAAARAPAAASATPEHLRPEILYRDQLSQLNELGFVDFEANINALVATGGNVQAAINRLLS